MRKSIFFNKNQIDIYIIEPQNLEKHLNKLMTKFNDKQFKFDVREESETDFFVKNIKKELK